MDERTSTDRRTSRAEMSGSGQGPAKSSDHPDRTPYRGLCDPSTSTVATERALTGDVGCQEG